MSSAGAARLRRSRLLGPGLLAGRLESISMDELKIVLEREIGAAAGQAGTIEPWHSFWHHRPELNFPPKTIRELADYQGGKHLALACTQTELSAAAQKKLLNSWCEYLPQLQQVEFLWLQSRVPQQLFDAACAMPKLKGLYIKWGGMTSAAAISAAGQLTYLHLGSTPSLQPLDVLSELTQLRWLELENIRASHDLSFLTPLTALRGLSLTGDSNSLKTLKLNSIAPLLSLQQLQWLQLQTVDIEDQSLELIAMLPALKQLLLSNTFPMAEIALLAGRRPDIHCDLFQPCSEVVSWTKCKKCQNATMVMLTGKGTPWLCTSCDWARISRHQDEFRRIVQNAAF